MCLAIPMKIIAIDGFTVRCEAKGSEREASTFMLQDEEFTVGEYVMVHLGYVSQKVSEAEAAAAWAIYDEMLSAS